MKLHDKRTAQTTWNMNIGEVKDTSVYNCLIILMTWIDELTVAIMDLQDEFEEMEKKE